MRRRILTGCRGKPFSGCGRRLGWTADPRPAGGVKLAGDEGWRIREGDWRAIYDIDQAAQVVTVLRVKHRKDVYRTF